MMVRAGLILMLAAAAPLAAETAAGKFSIVYKASPARVDYHVRQLDRFADTGEKEAPEWKISDVHQAIAQEVKPTPAGRLLVDGQVLGENVWSSEKADGVPAPLAESRPFRYELGANGSLAKEPDASDATAVMLPVFPDQPIAPGQKWTLERPVAPDGRTGCAMKGNATTAVSLTDGQLVHFEGFTALALKTAPLSDEPPRVMRRETLRTVVRQPAVRDAE